MRSVDDTFKMLTYTEEIAAKIIFKTLSGKDGTIICSKLSNEHNISRGAFVASLKLLEIAGLIKTRSLGRSGTMVKVLAPALWEVFSDA